MSWGKKRAPWVLGLVLIVGVATWFGVRKATHKAPPAPVAPTEITADLTGQIKAVKEFFVSIKSGGRLDKILVPEGSSVEQGAIIGMLDVNDRKSRVESALSGFSLATSDLGRIRSLYRSGAGTRQELDEATSRYDIKKAELTQARQNLEDGLIRAPIKGRLAVFAFSVGDVIPDGARVAIVEDQSSYYVTGRLDAVTGLKAGQPAKVRLQSLENGATKSEEVAGTLNPLSVTPSGETDVRLEFPNLPPGFTVRQPVRAELKIAKTATM